jgi:multidrug efflux pump subunit AcrA (membrane-fusion protein)
MKRLIAVLVTLVLAVATGAYTFRLLGDDEEGFEPPTPEVCSECKPTTTQPVPAEVPALDDDLLPVVGLVEPCTRVPARAELSCKLKAFLVREGEFVEREQTLAYLDSTECRLEIGQQQARVRAARQFVQEATLAVQAASDEWKRVDGLFRQKAVPGGEYVATKSRLGMARVRLAAREHQLAEEQERERLLQSRLGKHSLKAPLSGIVTVQRQLPGEFVREGEVVLRIESRQRRFRVYLTPTLADRQPRLRFSFYDGHWHTLRVLSLASHFNPDGTRTLLLEVPPACSVLVGQTVRLQVREAIES